MTLMVTYSTGEEARREFRIAVDSTELKVEMVTPTNPPRFYDVEYVVPAGAMEGKKKVTVKFEAVGQREVAGVCGVRMVRGEMPRQSVIPLGRNP